MEEEESLSLVNDRGGGGAVVMQSLRNSWSVNGSRPRCDNYGCG